MKKTLLALVLGSVLLSGCGHFGHRDCKGGECNMKQKQECTCGKKECSEGPCKCGTECSVKKEASAPEATPTKK